MNCHIKLLIIFSVLLAICGCVHHQTKIPFNKIWKFELSDDSLGAKIQLDDSSWDTVRIGNYGYNKEFIRYDGYAWYRTKIFIPSVLKNQLFKDSIKIFLGSIDDCDQVFLNGLLLGENGVVISHQDQPRPYFGGEVGLGSKKRKYILSVTDERIKWDEENLIAIRVYDQYGNGGMYNSNPYISMVGLDDYLYIDKSRFYRIDSSENLHRNLIVKNVSRRLSLSGELNVTAITLESK